MTADLLDPDELERLIETGEPDRSDVEEQILETAGITSPVWIEDASTESGVTIEGHVLLADYDDDISIPRDDADDASLSRLDLIKREAERLDGVTALFESSTGSYHLWNLSVENLSGRVLQALALHGDPMHVAVSWRRSMFVLRCSPKVYSTSIDDGEPERYKPAPTLIDVLDSESDFPQSSGHFEMLRTLAEEQGREQLLDAVDVDAHQWIGEPDRVEVSRYMTVTDDLKREVW